MRGRKTFKKPGKFGKLGIGASPLPPPPCTFGEAWTVGGKGVRGVLYDRLSRCNWVASGSHQRFSVESRFVRDAPPPFKEGTYCSTVPTPPKKLFRIYTIYRGVFFGASSFGRFGRRGKTPNLSQGVFTDTPCVTLSHQESVGASPVALERNHQPCSLMRRRNWRGSRVVRGSPQR
jgi:hypothetical protein